MRTLRVALLCLSGLVALSVGVALAQYPRLRERHSDTVDPNPGVEATIQLTVTATPARGGAAAGASCTAAISSQPGTGASVSPTSFVTGSNGQAVLTVQTGSASGQLRLSIVCGARTAAITLPVGAPPAPPATGTGIESRPGTAWSPGTPTLGLAGLATALTLLAAWKFARRPAR